MFLTEFFGKSLDIKPPSDRDHDDQEIANEVFQFILDHDRLHKEYFHPLAKKIRRHQQTKKENKSQLVKEFMPMVEKGCKEFYHKNKLTGKLGKMFPLDMREELCDRLYDHYCDDIKRDKYKLMEGGNLELPNPEDPTQPHQAQEIDLKVHNRTYMVGLLNKLLHDISAVFQAKYKKSLWSANLLQSREFLSGSSLHFFNTSGISDEEFAKYKPKVGDIDTQVDAKLEPEVEEFLTAMTGKQIGDTKFLGFSKGSAQFNGLFQFQDPPFKIQIDFEFGGYGEETGTPDEWFAFSHSSDWDDITAGIKGVFHKYLYRALAAGASTQQAYVAKLEGRGKARTMVISPEPEELSLLSFAVASKQGGGMSRKYIPYTDPETGESSRNGIPIVTPVKPEDRTYVQNLSEQFEMIFGVKPTDQDSQLQKSFIGTLDLINKYIEPEKKSSIIQDFLDICFEIGGQMITKNDPVRDAQTKFAAIDVMLEKLGMKNMRAQAIAQAKAYEDDFLEVEAYKAAHPEEKQPRAAIKKAKAAAQGLTEAEDKPQPAVKAQLRKGMPHLRDLKPADFLDLVDELQDSGGRFVLQNIPLNVKIDGFGGRFGKDAEGKPFMGTSRTEPKYKAGFLDYHKQKGTTDPEVLGRAANFDKLFNEMMTAVKMVDSALGPDFLMDRQVTCEVLFLPFATKTESGGLKFVGIEYDQIPEGVDLVLVPFRIVEGSTGEEIPNGDAAVQQIAELGQSNNVMFMSNRLVQKSGLDVTEIINVLDNIDELKDIVSGTAGKRDRASVDLRRQVEEKLKPVQIALERAIDEDPNIVGKDNLGTEYEGIVINSRLGPIKVTSQKQKDLIAAKQAARASARTERPRENSNKTAVVAIGSFIGHRGHQELWNYTVNKARELHGDPYLFIGNAEGKDDPIPPSVKVETWHQLYPQYAKNISTVSHEGGSLIQKIKHELINPLPGKPPRYDNIVIMVGEDRKNLNMPQALMKAVNKFQGYEHVKVSLDVTPRGQGVSGTMLRNAIKTQTPEEAFSTWNQAFNSGDFGAQQLPSEWIEHLMDISAKGMGIAPKAAEPEKTKEPVAERILTALINHKIPVAEDAEHELRQRLIRAIARATGYGMAELNLLSTAELKELVKKKLNHKQDTQESYWGGPSPAQKRFNRALERERKKSAPESERARKELDRIMGPRPTQSEKPEEKGVGENQSNNTQTVTRIDSKPISDFSSNLKAYKHADDWSQSGIDTGDDSYWEKNNIKTATTKGLFAGDPHRTALYATGNAHETRFVEFTENGQPIVYFDKKDLPKIRSRKTYLTVFDAADFKKLPTGEYFSENPGKPIKQAPIEDPFQYIADHGWVVRITDNLDKVFKQVKSMHKAGKIPHYGAEGMNESQQGVGEGLLDRFISKNNTKDKKINIGDYTLEIQTKNNKLFVYVTTAGEDVFDVAEAEFNIQLDNDGKKYLQSEFTKVYPKYQRKGIASMIYRYVKSLGYDIQPSSTQTDQGKSMWKGFRDKGMAEGMNESVAVEPDPRGYQKDILTSPKNTLVVDTPGDLDWYKIGQHYPALGTDDPHEYGQSDSDLVIVPYSRQELVDLKKKLDRLKMRYKDIGGGHEQPEIHDKVEEGTLNEFDHARHVELLNAHMKKLGYENIGAGLDAQVFAKETGPVKKILMPESGDISTAENSFLAFYNYCQANARNPHLPKFLNINKDIELDGEKFRQITMERLQEVDPDYDDMIMDMMESIEAGQPLDPQYKKHAGFYQTLKSVIETGRQSGFEIDIMDFNNSNVMQRGNTLVIADPWTEGSGLAEGLRDPEDNPCWKGYKPVGTKKKGSKTVPNCVPVSESVENIMSALINRIIVNEAIQNRQQ